jgi:hypothetical protein
MAYTFYTRPLAGATAIMRSDSRNEIFADD